MSYVDAGRIVFLDFETTGLYPELHSPLQMGAIMVNEATQTIEMGFSKHILPPNDCIVDPRAMEINGLKIYDMPEGSLTQDQCLDKFFDQFGCDYRFACWNTHFDIAIFRKMCVDNGKMHKFSKIDYHHIDVQSIIQYLRVRDFIPEWVISFNDALKYYELSRGLVHDGFEDANLLRMVYCCLDT
jgi:DNA polymerase III epsilon subunit-like protein